MNKILISDLHLTDSIKDSYRWGIFNWLERQIKKYRVKMIYILGDLTEKKDKHSSNIVNLLVTSLEKLTKQCEIIILKGNHDFIDQDNPFFKFLGVHPRICFIKQINNLGGKLFLPYTQSPEHDWKNIDFRLYHTIYMHQMVKGAIFANQHVSDEGIDGVRLKRDIMAKIFSGHIHVPQTMPCGIVYVGAPYSVYFGDHYKGRAILIKDNGKCIDLEPKFPKLWGVKIENTDDLDMYDIESTDILKVEIVLPRSEIHAYRDIYSDVKEWCKKSDVRLCGIKVKVVERDTKMRRRRKTVIGISNIDILEKFAKREKLSAEQIEKGEELTDERN